MRSSLLLLFLVACSTTQQKTASTVESDLCKARAAFKLAESVTPSLQPAETSKRAELEKAEDLFCASLADAS